jgi:hypothetical protein
MLTRFKHVWRRNNSAKALDNSRQSLFGDRLGKHSGGVLNGLTYGTISSLRPLRKRIGVSFIAGKVVSLGQIW